MRFVKLSGFFLILSAAACSSEVVSKDGDVFVQDQGSKKDSSSKDLGKDMAIKDMATKDMGEDIGTTDAGQDMSGGPIEALLGKSCDPLKRAGTIVLSRKQDLQVSALIYKVADPFVGDLKDSDAHCKFFEAARCKADQFGGMCSGGNQVCIKGSCKTPPGEVKTIKMEVSNGSETRIFESGMNMKQTLSGDQLSMKIMWGEQQINVPPMFVPEKLEQLKKKVIGELERLDLTWTPPTSKSTQVFTHIPINHHAYNQGTFVECAIEASKGKLEVAGKLLKPLSVVTGLEFQTVEHMSVASAESAEGCVEIRYQYQDFPR